MADTSLVSRTELDAISAASGFAIWELEQVVSTSNLLFLRDELLAGNLGVVVNPDQALAAPSRVGQIVQAASESEFIQSIEDIIETALPSLKGLGRTVIIVSIVGIVALVLLRR